MSFNCVLSSGTRHLIQSYIAEIFFLKVTDIFSLFSFPSICLLKREIFSLKLGRSGGSQRIDSDGIAGFTQDTPIQRVTTAPFSFRR